MAASRLHFHHQDSILHVGPSYEINPTGDAATEKDIDGDYIGENIGMGSERDHDRFDQAQTDREDMYRMNKKQELRRNFRFLSIFGYSLILGNGWVYSLTGAIAPLTNGGTAGGIWMYLIVISGMSFSTLSMAEMASMAPTAGGQYHWVSEFAPREHQRFLSYLTGWLCVSRSARDSVRASLTEIRSSGGKQACVPRPMALGSPYRA